MGEEKNVQDLMGKPEGKRPLGRPRHRWEGGIRIDLREIGWGSVDWIQLAKDRDLSDFLNHGTICRSGDHSQASYCLTKKPVLL
jgi:hypothetical protein